MNALQLSLTTFEPTPAAFDAQRAELPPALVSPLPDCCPEGASRPSSSYVRMAVQVGTDMLGWATLMGLCYLAVALASAFLHF